MNFLTTTQTKTHLTTICASEKSSKNFLSVAQNFQKLTKQTGHEIIWSIYRFESLFHVQSHDFLASTLTIQQFQNFSRLKLNVNSKFKFDKYGVVKGNKKSVSKTNDSTKNMHTVLFLLHFINQQLQNCWQQCCLISNEWFTENCDTIYTVINMQSRISLEVQKGTFENRSVDDMPPISVYCSTNFLECSEILILGPKFLPGPLNFQF